MQGLFELCQFTNDANIRPAPPATVAKTLKHDADVISEVEIRCLQWNGRRSNLINLCRLAWGHWNGPFEAVMDGGYGESGRMRQQAGVVAKHILDGWWRVSVASLTVVRLRTIDSSSPRA